MLRTCQTLHLVRNGVAAVIYVLDKWLSRRCLRFNEDIRGIQANQQDTESTNQSVVTFDLIFHRERKVRPKDDALVVDLPMSQATQRGKLQGGYSHLIHRIVSSGTLHNHLTVELLERESVAQAAIAF